MSAAIGKAFTLEALAVELRWGIHEKPFRSLFAKAAITQITAGHLMARCRLLGGLESEVHFHFSPRHDGRFTQVEL